MGGPTHRQIQIVTDETFRGKPIVKTFKQIYIPGLGYADEDLAVDAVIETNKRDNATMYSEPDMSGSVNECAPLQPEDKHV